MRRHELLRSLHELLEPRSYFEIGVNTGRSLTMSRTRSVGVDPFFAINRELHCDLHLVRASSDEFFARRHPFAHLDEPVVDLAFIDGMHLSEYALRDLINTERYTRSTSAPSATSVTVASARTTRLPVRSLRVAVPPTCGTRDSCRTRRTSSGVLLA